MAFPKVFSCLRLDVTLHAHGARDGDDCEDKKINRTRTDRQTDRNGEREKEREKRRVKNRESKKGDRETLGHLGSLAINRAVDAKETIYVYKYLYIYIYHRYIAHA